jgi:hypothetical protein
MALITLGANSGKGKILQVVQAVFSSAINVTSTSLASTGMSASITPSSTSNKILAIASISPYQDGNGRQTFFTWDRNSTLLNPASNGLTNIFASNSNIITPCTLNFLDTPSSSSSLTYTIFSKTNVGTVQINSQNDSTIIQLMEIAG